MINSINDMVNIAIQKETATLVVACAADHHVLEAVEMAREKNIINPILVGSKNDIITILTSLKYALNKYKIIDEPDPIKACELSVKLVHDHSSYFLMKGLVSTSTILKAALNKEQGLRTGNRISHVSVMETNNYHKLLFMTDGAMNIAPSLDEKRQIIENAITVAHALGITTPNVGIIGAVEKINPAMEATLDAAELVKMNSNGKITGCKIGGPFAIDNAINKEAAMHKGITDPMAGNVDILLMPRIEAGNVFYKTMMFLANAKSASVIAGATKPIVLTSRADSKETKFNSIVLASLMVQN
jgi:phosphate butyryltransferase